MFHVCSLADSMNSLRGEWYQKWQTGEPVAPRGAGQWRGFQMDRLMKGERGATSCPLVGWQRLRASPGLSEGVGGTCYCSWR